ncbi:MAG: 50S ribosomal protein L29 [Chloroflexi bacterium RBG_16_52_11]|nr:MAG: 50S ribosomal protein L29 [Chloroflexi bacterium RBG_16_52_11]
MIPSEIRNLSTDEIQAKLNDAREELMNLRFQMAMGGLTDYTRLRFTRRNIARFMTVLNEREMSAGKESE